MSDEPRDEFAGVYRSLVEMSLRTAARHLEPKFAFAWQFDRSRYPDSYLVQRFNEQQVQDAIIAELKFWKIDVIAIDAGMKRARGRMIQAAKSRGLDVSNIVNFKAGGLPAGWPDLHATLSPDGVGLYVEVKAPAWIDPDNYSRIISEAGKPTEEQLAFLDSKRERGAVVLVAWSVGDVMKVLGDRADKNRAALDPGL